MLFLIFVLKKKSYVTFSKQDLIFVCNFKIGFNTEGLQTLVSKLVGPLGELTKGKSIVDVLKQRVRRSAESAQPSDPISQIHKQVEKISTITLQDNCCNISEKFSSKCYHQSTEEDVY